MNIFLISVLASIIPIGAYILFLRWLDRYEREPLKHIILVFIFGATISVGFSYVANTIVGYIGHALLTRAGSEYFLAGLVAPVVEEVNKGIIVLMFAWASKEFDNVTDGLLYGAVVGLGFAFSENVMYFMRVYHQSGQFAWIHNMYVRSFFSAGVHACATALFGGCLAYGRHARWVEKLVCVCVGWALAMMVHSFWNSLLAVSEISQDNFLAVLPLLGLPLIFLALFVLFQISLSKESQMIGEELALEAQTGTLPLEHVAILRSSIKRDESGWFVNEATRWEYVSTATELAFARDRYRKLPDNKKQDAEKEIERVRSRLRVFLGNDKGGIGSPLLVFLTFFSFLIALAFFGSWSWKKLLLDFPAYAVAKQYISSNEKISELLGPIQVWDVKPSGDFDYNSSGGDGYLKLDLQGAKGKGKLEISFYSDFGIVWNIDKATLKLPAQAEPIKLDGPAEWLSSAQLQIDQRKYDDAAKTCGLIQKAVAEDDRIQQCFAELALAQGDHQKYISIWKDLSDKYPLYPNYQTRLAYAYYVAGDDAHSIESYKKSYELKTDPELASSIAYVYLNSGKTDEALEWMDKAKESGLRSATLAYRYGWYYYEKKEVDKAIEYFNISRETDPSYAMPYFGLGYASFDQNRNDDAIYFFEEGIQRAPNDSYRHRMALIDLLMRLRYNDEAVFHLIRTTIYHPQELAPYVILSKLYQRQGRDQDANYAFSLASKSNSDEAQRLSQEFDYLSK